MLSNPEAGKSAYFRSVTFSLGRGPGLCSKGQAPGQTKQGFKAGTRTLKAERTCARTAFLQLRSTSLREASAADKQEPGQKPEHPKSSRSLSSLPRMRGLVRTHPLVPWNAQNAPLSSLQMTSCLVFIPFFKLECSHELFIRVPLPHLFLLLTHKPL